VKVQNNKNGADVIGALRLCLEEDEDVEIDGLGRFCREGPSAITFVPSGRPRAFLAYVEEDTAKVERVYDSLERNGFAPWMDRRKLLPGQNWPRAIERAISISDYFIACFSSSAATKKGHFHAELRYALDCASMLPMDEIYFIPVRLNECYVPERIRRMLQYVDLFPDFDTGLRRVMNAMRRRPRLASGSQGQACPPPEISTHSRRRLPP